MRKPLEVDQDTMKAAVAQIAASGAIGDAIRPVAALGDGPASPGPLSGSSTSSTSSDTANFSRRVISAAWTAPIASEDAFCSVFRNLQDLVRFAFFSTCLNSEILKIFVNILLILVGMYKTSGKVLQNPAKSAQKMQKMI